MRTGAKGKGSQAEARHATISTSDYIGSHPTAIGQQRASQSVTGALASKPSLVGTIESEDDLAERLKAHGHDPYAGGPYETYADRLGACIVRNGVSCVLVGRGPDGKPENYAQAYERLYGRALPQPVSRSAQTKNVPRDVSHKQLDGGSRETHTQRPPRVPPVDPAPDAATPGGAAGAKAGG